MEKVIVIGANHAGTHVITTLLDNYKDKVEVTTYDKNTNISFLGCGMALWIGNQIESSDGLFYASPESLTAAGANVHMSHELISVDFQKKCVVLKDIQEDREFIDYYDKLVLAMGSWPILPKLEGYDLDNIMYAKIFQNAEMAIAKSKDETIKNIVIIGAGYIGVELAEAFQKNGKQVTLINDTDVLNCYYDEAFQKKMQKRLEENGVNVLIGERVEKYLGKDGKVCAVQTPSKVIDADLVLVAVGFKANTEIFENTVLELDDTRTIVVDEYQKTNLEDVYAVGDCATVYSNASQRKTNICLATNAVRTGIVAAHNIGGTKIAMQGVQGSNAIHIYGLTLASTGLTVRSAQEQGYDVNYTHVKEKLKPGFMKENDDVELIVVWDKKTRRILGAQMASETDITLALHMFSLAIQENYSIDKLALLDLFFLPHFNQPVNFITKAGLLSLGK